MRKAFARFFPIALILCLSIQPGSAETPPDEYSDHSSEVSAVLRQATESADPATREAAVKSLLANIENYGSGAVKGPYEAMLKARLKAIDSVWALGELGDPALMAPLIFLYRHSDDVIRMNVIISMGKLKKNNAAGPFIAAIAADTGERETVRALAFEVLDLMKFPFDSRGPQRSKETGIEKADIIYTGGLTGTISGWVSPDLPVGHTGLFVGTEEKDGRIRVIIADCVPNFFRPGGVRNIYSWYDFTHHFKYPYYGNRTTQARPTAAQREFIAALALEMGTKGLKYNSTHTSQKGPDEFDCVGYTEYLYERAGLNPTENKYENGLGWPLTPWEQFIAAKPNTPPNFPFLPLTAGAPRRDRQPLIHSGAAELGAAFSLDLAPREVVPPSRPAAE